MSIVDELFPPVETIVKSYLAPGEVVTLEDKPALGRFFLIGLREIVMVGILSGSALMLAKFGYGNLGLLVFVVADGLVIHLVSRRIQDYYTRYVITDLRIMRTSGVFSRVAYSIPLGKITDVAFSQKWWERRFGYATIEIDSASEKSGLDKLRGLHDPAKFNRVLLAMVADKQGFVVPGTAALNKRRAREEHLKLLIRFNINPSELFPDATEKEMYYATLANNRDLADKAERQAQLFVMQTLAADLAGGPSLVGVGADPPEAPSEGPPDEDPDRDDD